VPVDSPESYDNFIKDIPTALTKITDILTGSAKKLLMKPEFISLVSKEFHSSISKSAMVERVRKFIPTVQPENFPKRGTSGIRTPVISPDGEFISDMIEIFGKNSFHIVNYNTPGATGAPAYSAFVVKKLQENGILDKPTKSKDSIWNFGNTIEQI
jgi:L-2-hydroxyglutarate oxidase